MASQDEQPEPSAPVAVKSGKGTVGGFWRTGLLLTSSAALGGIAVAIWNRRSLARMRQQIDASTASASRNVQDAAEDTLE